MSEPLSDEELAQYRRWSTCGYGNWPIFPDAQTALQRLLAEVDRLKALLVSPVGKQEENLAPNPATSQNGAEGFGFAWKLPSGEEFRAMWFLDGAVVISLFAASDPDGTLSRGSVRIPPKVIPDLVAFLTSAPAGSTI